MGTANPASTGQARVERGKAEPAEALLWTCPCCLPPKWLASPSYYSVLLLFFFLLWLHWVLVVECRLSLVAASRDHSLWQCMDFSLQWLLLLYSTGFRHVGSAVARLELAGSRAQAQ